MTDDDKSLGDDATLGGESPEQEVDARSLGDQSTHGDHSQLDSVGNPSSLGDQLTFGGDGAGEALNDGMEIVDLESRYTIERVLGKGGMGEVLLATDTRLERQVAIKRILGKAAGSKTAVNRFLTEAKAVAALNHPNIVQVYDYGRDKQGPFLIMEYVAGQTLLERCQQGAIALKEAIELTVQLCDGLAAAHDAHIVHRDVKPANILLTKSNIPKLTDFGLAKAETADTGMTQEGAVLGTHDFMPPEQRKDAALVDARSDLWSLAATLYQMLTGETPRVIDLDAVPRELRTCLAKALKTNKDDRYQTAGEMGTALQECLAGPDISPTVQLGAGECPSCHTLNEAGRKFCSGCAAPLRAPCFGCQIEIPLWDNICGDCGANQTELQASARKHWAAQQAKAVRLLKEFDFDGAEQLAKQAANSTDSRLGDHAAWTTQFLEDLPGRRQLELERVQAWMRESNVHKTAHDYLAGLRVLQQVPPSLLDRTLPEYSQTPGELLHEFQETLQRISTLKAEIQQRVKNRELVGLRNQVAELLALCPERPDLQKLLRQLDERDTRNARRMEEALTTARQLRSQCEFTAAAAKLQKISADAMSDEAQQLLDECQWLATERQNTIDLVRSVNSATKLQGISFQVENYFNTLGQLSLQDIQVQQAVANLKQKFGIKPPQTPGAKFNRAKQANQKQGSNHNVALTVSLIVGIFVVAVGILAFVAYQAGLFSSSPSSIAQQAPSQQTLSQQTLSQQTLSQQTLSQQTPSQQTPSQQTPSQQTPFQQTPSKTAPPEPSTQPPANTDSGESPSGETDKMAAAPDSQLNDPAKTPTTKSTTTPAGEGTTRLQGRLITTLVMHSNRVEWVCFSPNGKQIVSCSDDDYAKLWDAETGQQAFQHNHRANVNGASFSPDGKWLVTCSDAGTWKVWDAETGKERFTPSRLHSEAITCIDYSPDGRWIVTGADDKTAKLWDANSGKNVRSFNGHSSFVRSVSFSPDGKRIVSGCGNMGIIWDSTTGREITPLEGNQGDFSSVTFSPDGKRIAGGCGKTVKVWDAETAQLLLTLPGHQGGVERVNFSPNGKWIVSGAQDNQVKVWDAETSEELLTLKGHPGAVRSVAFSPDGKRLVSGCYANTVKVWELNSEPVDPPPAANAPFDADTAKPAWMDQGLVAHYPFNGNAKDESGNGHDGKIEGVALTLDRHGHENAAYRFKSKGDRIAVRNSLRGLTASSLSLHLSCSQPTEQFCVLAAVGNIGTGTVFDLTMIGDQKITKIRHLQLSTSLGVKTKKSMQSFDRWYHVVLTQADDVAKVYVDGILVDILSSKTVVINGPAEQSLIFGSKWEGGIYPVGWGMWQYRGSLDDVRIYNRALSDDEVKALYDFESQPLAASAQSPPTATAPFNTEQAKAHQTAWAKHLGTQVEITNSIGMKFAVIPPGEFMMGSPEEEPGRGDDETLHRVTLTEPFFMSVTEVTQFAYGGVMGKNASTFKGSDQPVEMVSWSEAYEFCVKLSNLPAEKRAGRVYRLPTEAEWEYACRAGTTTRYSFGDDLKELSTYAWWGQNADGKSHPVGLKEPNHWGLYDMHGNLYEWSQVKYGDYPGGSVTDPTGAASGADRVLRGGAWFSSSGTGNIRSAGRDHQPPGFHNNGVGIRVVCTVIKKTNSNSSKTPKKTSDASGISSALRQALVAGDYEKALEIDPANPDAIELLRKSSTLLQTARSLSMHSEVILCVTYSPDGNQTIGVYTTCMETFVNGVQIGMETFRQKMQWTPKARSQALTASAAVVVFFLMPFH